MTTKRILRYLFTLLTLAMLGVIAYNIAVHTDNADMSVFAAAFPSK